MSYTIEKPNTSYTTEKDCPYKFSNTDVSFDTAVANIIKNNEDIPFPNQELVMMATSGKKWWGGDDA